VDGRSDHAARRDRQHRRRPWGPTWGRSTSTPAPATTSPYIAGGNAGDPTIIASSLSPDANYATPTATGQGRIVSLAPGGGIALVFVGKEQELASLTPPACTAR
jgi:hypothetical protein